MKNFAAFLLAALIFAPGADASLRARYVYCVNINDTISTSCSGKSYNNELWVKVLPGIWDGWSDQTGFDHIDASEDDALGPFDDAPYVTGSYWLDSLFEEVHGTNSDGAFVQGWMSSSDMLDPSYEFSYDGYFVLAAGGLKIPEAGTYEFFVDGDDGIMYFLDLDEDGVLSLEPNNHEGVNVGPTLRDGHLWGWEKGHTATVTFSSPGYKKILFWKWDWGAISDGMLKWKKPGDDSLSVIPAAAFGERKNTGLPVASIVSVSVEGQGEIPKNSWSYIPLDKCVPITLTVETENMTDFDGNELPAEYFWDLNDGRTAITPVNTITYCYNKDAGSQLFFNPKVMVERDGRTMSVSSKQVVLLSVTETGDEPDCGEQCEIAGSNTSRLVRSSGRLSGIKTVGNTITVSAGHRGLVSAFAYNVSGRRSALVYNEMAKGFDLKSSGLSAGYYVVDILVDGKKVGATSMVLRK